MLIEKEKIALSKGEAGSESEKLIRYLNQVQVVLRGLPCV